VGDTLRPLLAASIVLIAVAASADEAGDSPMLGRAHETEIADLDRILERGSIWVLVAPSVSSIFFDGKQLRGFEYELMRAYEKKLAARLGSQRFQMFFVPLRFDELLPALNEGRGDIAAAGLTITPGREQEVAFSDPYLSDVSEIVVARRGVEGLETLDDLAGREVYVAAGSSYEQHLRGRVPKARTLVAPEALEANDLLELVNAGVIDLTVVDDHLGRLWAEVLPDVVLREDLRVHEGGRIAWAVRQGSPLLREDLSAFAREHREGTLLGNILFRRYFENTRFVTNPNAVDPEKSAEVRALFRKYAKRYDFEWAELAALAYQESRFDQSVRSRAGAVGIMQVLPSTAKAVGVNDIHLLENNIHAGTKYLDSLRAKYFDEPEISAEASVDFALASYNAGPNRIQRMRRRAAERGYDPDVWFDHVESVVLTDVGWEPVRYVAAIHKYYFAFRLGSDQEELRRAERERLLEGQ
jgi:membrane-bound lytic murein transglycosylase MltF